MTTSLVCDDFPALTGRQDPHHESRFPGSEAQGRKSVELARRTRRALMPWQVSVLVAMLATTVSGQWTHPDCCLIVPRQNGKSLILVLRCLFGLFVRGERIVYSSQRWPTAKDAYERLWSIIKSRPSLRRLVVKNTCSQGQGYIELESGARIVFCTRSNDSGRGLDEVDLVIYDEAYNLTEGEIAALSFTQLASRNPQTIYASSAVNAEQHPNGWVLAGVRERGLAGDEGLYFAEWMAPEDMPREDEATWRYANPSYGVIQTAEKIRKLIKGFSTPAGRRSFDVEALGRGIWPQEKPEDEVEIVLDPVKWAALVSPRGVRLVGPIGLAVDMDPERAWCSIAAAQHTADGRVHVEVGYHGPPTAAVRRLLRTVIVAWDPCALVIDNLSPAITYKAELAADGVEVETTTGAEMAAACGGLQDAIEQGTLSHTGDPLLEQAREAVVKRVLPSGAWAFNRRAGGVISPMVAVALAKFALLKFGHIARPPEQAPTQDHEIAVPDDGHALMAAGF